MDFTLPNEQEVLEHIDAIKEREASLDAIVEDVRKSTKTLEDVKRELIPTVNNRVHKILNELYQRKTMDFYDGVQTRILGTKKGVYIDTVKNDDYSNTVLTLVERYFCPYNREIKRLNKGTPIYNYMNEWNPLFPSYTPVTMRDDDEILSAFAKLPGQLLYMYAHRVESERTRLRGQADKARKHHAEFSEKIDELD